MKYAIVLTILSGAADDAQTLLAAGEMAHREGAQLKVIPSQPLASALVWADSFGGSVFAGAAVQEIMDADRRLRTDMKRLVDEVGERLDIGGHASPHSSIEFLDEQQPPWVTLTREAPLADIVVVGAAATRDEGFWGGLYTDALMTLRMPLLIVRAPEMLEGGVVAVAWDGSVPSGRAARAALPLLRVAKSVIILQDAQGMTREELEAGDPIRLKSYLLAQGVPSVSIREIGGRREGESLLAAAKAAGAGLFVSGAFGHSRLRELVSGGTTRVLAADAAGPHLLFAH